MKTVFITGTAGFIGFHLARQLLEAGYAVVGYDGMTDYYDGSLLLRELVKIQTCWAKKEGRWSTRSTSKSLKHV